MALKGLDIFKMSPKKNCKECGCPTCMAFCMKVAQGAAEIDKCPYFSEDAKASLNEATAPAMKTITVGEHKLGGETVLYRHEKTLVYSFSIVVAPSERYLLIGFIVSFIPVGIKRKFRGDIALPVAAVLSGI